MSKILQQDYQEYSKLIEEGHSQRSACLILGLNRSTIQRYIKGVLEDGVSDVVEQYLDTPKKPSLTEACSNVASAIGNIGKAMIVYKPHCKINKPTICVIADLQCKPTESL